MQIPTTISPAAKAVLRNWDPAIRAFMAPAAGDAEAWARVWQKNENAMRPANEAVVAAYGPAIERRMLGGVAVLDIRPRGWRESEEVLVYVHGGAYTMFSAESTRINSVPVAHDTGRRVVAVDYTLAPRAKHPQILDGVCRVVAGLLAEGRSPSRLAIYGDSAGGALAAAAVLKRRDEGLPLPAAVVLQSPWSDIAERGDSYQSLQEADPFLPYAGSLRNSAEACAPPEDWGQPYVSPVNADYRPGFPPTLIQGGTREIFLSNFVRHYQALAAAGIEATLDLYEGMWHVFQAFHHELPESQRARARMAEFLARHAT